MRYIFEPEEVARIVHQCLKESGNRPLEPLLRRITSALARRYPGQIEEKWDWVFSVVGGGNQQVTILHVSLCEHLTIVSWQRGLCRAPSGTAAATRECRGD